MQLVPVKKKDICSPYLMRKIRQHAIGSVCRMNAGSADCYEFAVDDSGKDWEGGWDWSKGLVASNPGYILMLDTGKVFKVQEEK